MIFASDVTTYSDGPGKIIIAALIIMALWGQKIVPRHRDDQDSEDDQEK